MDTPWGRLYLAVGLCLLMSVLVERVVRPAPRFRGRPRAAWSIHFGSVLLCFGAMLAVSQRPLFAATLAIALWLLLAAVNNAKFRALREPFIFSDFALFSQALRFPRLYLPFLGIAETSIGGVTACSALLLGISIEPAASSGYGSGGYAQLLAAVFALASILLLTGLRDAAAPSLDPAADVQRLGLLASLWLYRLAEAKPLDAIPCSVYGRLETPRRHERIGGRTTDLPHVVVVQSESFFDARRLMPEIRREVLGVFDAVQRQGRGGRLSVPAWGANTMRTEFSFLSGLPAQSLGVHRFNPYRRYARRPVPGLAHYLRTQGYRTLCIHPHPIGFFGRDKVFPQLGFDQFVDLRGFRHAENFGPYVADAAVAAMINEVLAAASEPVFIFAITMENHGPLHLERVARGEHGGYYTETLPVGFDDLTVYLRHLSNADRMLDELRQGLAPLDRDSVLGFYGDHVPSMPDVYRRLDYRDGRTDYLVWRRDRPDRMQRDLEVESLGEVILDVAGLNPAPSVHLR